MTFRTKLLVVFVLALLSSVGVIAVGVTIVARRAFDTMNQDYSDALVGQFEREVDRHKQGIVNRVQGIADAEGTVRMAIDLSRPQADVSVYVNDANGLSKSHQLDFLDFLSNDGSIISSNEWPARFGYKMDWVTQTADWTPVGAFLTKVDTQNGPEIGLMAVSTVRVGDKNLYIVGGERLGKDFLASLVLPAGMRALLYLNLDPSFDGTNLVDQSGSVTQAERFAPFIEQERNDPRPQTFKILWSGTPMSAEGFHALPLLGRSNDLLGVLLVGSSQRQMAALEQRIAVLALGVIAMGLFFGMLMSWWGAARVTRPVRRLSEGARAVTEGNWNARVDVRGKDEMGQLSRAFNRMTEQLSEQRERLVQAERVAAWRELARRLAHELKNPLFPLQTTVENLRRAKERGGEHGRKQFEEVFQESTGNPALGNRQPEGNYRPVQRLCADAAAGARAGEPERSGARHRETVRGAVQRARAAADHAGAASGGEPAGRAGGCDAAAARDRESDSERDGRDAVGRRPDAADGARGWRREPRGFGYGERADAGRVRAAVHAVLHDEAARDGAGAGDRAVRGERSWRADFG